MRHFLIVVCLFVLFSGCKPSEPEKMVEPEKTPKVSKPEKTPESEPVFIVESKDGGVPESDAFQTAFQRAKKMEDSGDTDGASLAYQMMTQDFPNRYEPYHRLAMIYERNSDEDAATALYEEALRLRPKDASFYNDYGWYLVTLRQYPEAHVLLYQAVRMAEGEKKYQNNLACCLTYEKRYEEAFLMFQKASDGDSSQAYMNLARNQILLEDAEAARASLEKVLVYSPKNEEAKELLKILKDHAEPELK